MRTLPFETVKLKDGAVAIADFSEYTDVNVNSAVSKAVTGYGYEYLQVDKLPFPPLKIYCAKDKTVYYLADKKLYYKKDGIITTLCPMTFNSPPDVFPLTFRGEPAIAVKYGGLGFILGSDYAFTSFPDGEGHIVHNGVLCSYQGDRVNFGGEYDYAGYTVSVRQSGFLGVENIGNIIALTRDENQLVAFCQNGVCYMDLKGERENYTVNYSSQVISGVDGCTVKTIASSHYFIMNGSLYELNKTVKKIKTPLDGTSYLVTNPAFIMDGKYCLPVYKNGEYIFVYDTVTGDSAFVNAKDKVFCDGGRFADKVTLDAGVIIKSNGGEYEWTSLATDLGDEEDKTLYKISVKTLGEVKVKVSSEQGEREFSARGAKTVRLTLRGKQFKFKLSGRVDSLPVELFKIYYRR